MITAARRYFSLLVRKVQQSVRSSAIYVGKNRLLVGTTIRGSRYAFYVEADDRLLTPWFALTGTHEEDVTQFLLSTVRSGSNCIDVGANFGYFMCLMARNCGNGRVLAIEPDTELADIAKDNIYLNGLQDQATVIKGAASDRTGELTLYRREYRSGNTSISAVGQDFTELLNEPPAAPFTVNSHTIDELAERLDGRVDLMKIDVEGAEPLVLAGAARTIANNPDLVIVMEWSPGQVAATGISATDFAQRIAALGLKCSVLSNGGETPVSVEELGVLPYQSAIILRRQ